VHKYPRGRGLRGNVCKVAPFLFSQYIARRNFECHYTGAKCHDSRCKKGYCALEQEDKRRDWQHEHLNTGTEITEFQRAKAREVLRRLKMIK
jgi:hypothetical protein